MSCRNGEYNGLFGQLRETILTQIPASDISDIAILTDKCLHNGTLKLNCAGSYEGGTGVFEEMIIRLLNDVTAAVFPEVTCYVFNVDLTSSAPVSGSDLIFDATEYAGLVCRFDIPIATAIPGVSPNDKRAIAEGINLNRKYQCADNNNSLYLVLINKGSSISFDANATIDVESKLRID